MKVIATSIILLYNILFIDSKTKETLSGVRVETNVNTYYTDQSGSVDIPRGEKVINISYISYQDINKTFINRTDTVIKLINH
jgi:hypothetical protein